MRAAHRDTAETGSMRGSVAAECEQSSYQETHEVKIRNITAIRVLIIDHSDY